MSPTISGTESNGAKWMFDLALRGKGEGRVDLGSPL